MFPSLTHRNKSKHSNPKYVDKFGGKDRPRRSNKNRPGRCSERIRNLTQIPMTSGEVAAGALLLIMMMYLFFQLQMRWGEDQNVYSSDQSADGLSFGSVTTRSPLPKSLVPFVANTHDQFAKADGEQGTGGGQWSMCSHIEKYGPNFDRGMANFMAGILRPQSALEIGCGIGLYINFMERFTTAAVKDQGRFLGVEPEPMVQAKVFGQDPYRAQQLMLNVLDAESQQAVADLGTFDVVLSSEVIEHIPCDLHSAFLDVLTDRTGKFLVFGAARPGQGGTGHICLKWTRDRFLEEFKKRGLVHLPIRIIVISMWDIWPLTL